MQTSKFHLYKSFLLTGLITFVLLPGLRAQTLPNDWYLDQQQIILESSPGKCIDLRGGKTANGSNIQLWNCATSNANHR